MNISSQVFVQQILGGKGCDSFMCLSKTKYKNCVVTLGVNLLYSLKNLIRKTEKKNFKL